MATDESQGSVDLGRRVVVYGAGAVGGVIGASLFRVGIDVLLIARGEHHDAIRDRGLRWISPDDDVTLPIPVAPHPGAAAIRDTDVLFFAMKSQDTPAAIDVLATSSPPEVAIVCAQNGVENERTAIRCFPNVYAANVMVPTAHLEAGVVESYSRPLTGIVDIGRYPTGTDELAHGLATTMTGAGFDARALPDMMRWKYTKLLMNLGNAIDAICGPSDDADELLRRARSEAEACLAASHIERASDEEFQERRGDVINQQPIDGRTKAGASTWQSLARGTGSVEADYLNGEVALLGRLHDVPTPVNALLQQVVRSMAQSGEPPASRDAGDLLALCGSAKRR